MEMRHKVDLSENANVNVSALEEFMYESEIKRTLIKQCQYPRNKSCPLISEKSNLPSLLP